MTMFLHEALEDRLRNRCCIEREDSRDRGRSVGRNGPTSSRSGDTGGGGAGTRALMEGPTITRNKPKTQPGPNQKVTPGNQGPVRMDRSVHIGKDGFPERNPQPEGGSATSWDYEPGDVPNQPYADTGAIVEQAMKALPGGTLVTMGGMLEDDGSMMGDPGPTEGFQRDRSKGAGSFNSNDPRGADAGLLDERSIAGQSLGERDPALTAPVDQYTPGPQIGDDWSDVTLRDRRKPREIFDSLMQGL